MKPLYITPCKTSRSPLVLSEISSPVLMKVKRVSKRPKEKAVDFLGLGVGLEGSRQGIQGFGVGEDSVVA